MRIPVALLILLSTFANPYTAHADTVDFTMTMTASGYVNGIAFIDQPFTIAATYNTADVQVSPQGVHVIFTTLYYTIPSLETQPPNPFVGVGPSQYIACYTVACAVGTQAHLDLLDTANPAGFNNYDLVTPISPVIGSGHNFTPNVHHAGYEAETDAGLLELDRTSLVLTTFIFHAATPPAGPPVDPPTAVTPEPSPFLLLGTGLVGLGSASVRRLRRR